jgi:hypothetical protein
MCGSVSVKPFNYRARCSENLAHRLPAWEAFSFDDAEALLLNFVLVKERVAFQAYSILMQNVPLSTRGSING